MLGVTVNAVPLFPVIYIFLRVQLFISPVFSLIFKNSLLSRLGVYRNNKRKSKDKGPVIIYRLGGEGGGFGAKI